MPPSFKGGGGGCPYNPGRGAAAGIHSAKSVEFYKIIIFLQPTQANGFITLQYNIITLSTV